MHNEPMNVKSPRTRADRRVIALLSAAFLLTGFFLVGAPVPPAAATAPGLNGIIAGVSSGNIVFADPVRHSYRYVTFGHEASWAPSGDMLAVGQGSGMLRIVSSTGATIRQIDDQCFRSDPTWSPDGSQIAYSSCVGLSIVNSDGTSPTPVPNSEGFSGYPEWSPDGSWIAMIKGDDADIWKIEPDGENLTHVLDRDGVQVNPTWSPDSQRIAFEDWSDPSNHDIYIVDAVGGQATRVTSSPAIDGHPSWTPQGTRLLFNSSRQGGGMFTMRSDGTDVRRVDVPISLDVPVWQPAQVTLRASRLIVDAAATARLDIRVASPGTDVTAVVVQRRNTAGPWVEWRTVHVDGGGRASISVMPKEHTFYRAIWAGDATHLGGRSLQELVKVRSVVTGHLFRSYGRDGPVHLYHLGRRIWYTSDIVPALAGKKMCFRMDRKRPHGWAEVFTDCYEIAGNGVTTIYIFNVPLGLRGRVRAFYRGDAGHLADHAPWDHFRVTT